MRGGLALVAVGIAVLSAGCGFVLGLEPMTVTGSEATVADQALADTEYREGVVTTQNATRNVSAFGQTREIQVFNRVATYRSASGGAVLLLSAPQVEVGSAAVSFDPLSRMTVRNMLPRFDPRYESLTTDERTGNEELTILGTDRDVDAYNGTATVGGREVPVTVLVAEFSHQGDNVAAVAVSPADTDDRAAETLLTSIEHTGDEQTTPE